MMVNLPKTFSQLSNKEANNLVSLFEFRGGLTVSFIVLAFLVPNYWYLAVSIVAYIGVTVLAARYAAKKLEDKDFL